MKATFKKDAGGECYSALFKDIESVKSSVVTLYIY